MDNPSANKSAGLLEKLLFTVRAPWLIVFLLLTLFLGYHASQVRPDASLTKMIPTNHPFIQNYFDYQDDLASLGNVVRVAVEHKDGDIFHPRRKPFRTKKLMDAKCSLDGSY